jgi:hypothetical protein
MEHPQGRPTLFDTRGTVILALAIGVFCVHAAWLGDWLIDDAGISFAYARNLAAGHGLVSQPGLAPLEGFSNPLWTLLLSGLFAARLFVIPWSVKALSVLLVATSFVMMARASKDHRTAPGVAALPVLLLALNTSFVVWTVSGLENPLLVLLVVASAWLTMKADTPVHVARHDLLAGAVAGLLALTRPDAIVYAGAYPMVLGLTRPRTWRALVPRLARYALAAGLLGGGYELFRWAYFGDLVPNTFHAKVQPFLLAFAPDRILDLARSAAGRTTPLVVALLVGASVLLLRRRDAGLKPVTLTLYLALATLVYWLMPPDWMGEYRFATAFFVFFYWVLGESLATLSVSLARWPAPARGLAPAVALLVLTETLHVQAARSGDFARNPTVPFARVSEFGRAYDRLAAAAWAASPSLLAPDLGGTLFEARHLRIYDLAGLCDRTIARTLMTNSAAFHDYIFDSARPTFIHVHGSWSGWAELHKDARFLRDYVPLHEVWDAPTEARHEVGDEPWAADYVRRDALRDASDLSRMQDEFRRLGLDRTLP